jgi:hypothetical protein
MLRLDENTLEAGIVLEFSGISMKPATAAG